MNIVIAILLTLSFIITYNIIIPSEFNTEAEYPCDHPLTQDYTPFAPKCPQNPIDYLHILSSKRTTAINATSNTTVPQNAVPFNYHTFNVEGVDIGVKIPPGWTEIEPQYDKHFANFITDAVNNDGSAIGDMRLGVDINPTTSDLNQYVLNEINIYRNEPAFENYEVITYNISNEPGTAPSYELWSTHTNKDTGTEYATIEYGGFFKGKLYFIYTLIEEDYFTQYLSQINEVLGSLTTSG